MKNLFFLVVFCLLCAACSKESVEQSIEQTVAPVTVSVNNFSITQEDFSGTRAPIPVAESTNVQAVTLAFYSGNTEVYKVTQLKNDASTYTTFGVFSLSLPMGSYTMVVLAYDLKDGDALTLTSPTQAAFTSGSVRDMFSATQSVTITNTSAVNLSATLSRVVSKLRVVSSENRPANVASVRLTLSAGGNAFSPTSGLATVNTGVVCTPGFNTEVGHASQSNAYVFLATDEQSMDVTIDVLDGEGTNLYHKVVNNVPFMRNRMTKLTGSMYSASSSSSFLVETGWDTTVDINF